MNLAEFNILPYERQLMAVFDQGQYLTRRWEDEDGINLYLLPGGVFVELYYDSHRNEIVRLRALTNSDELLAFVSAVRLPDPG